MGCKGEEGVTCVRVSLAETVTVPGGHEMVMLANVGLVSDDVTGIIELCPGFVSKHSILVARVVAKPRNNQVPVRVLILLRIPWFYTKAQHLGRFLKQL